MNMADVPFIDEYFGAWLIEPERADRIEAHLRRLNINLHLDMVASQRYRHKDDTTDDEEKDAREQQAQAGFIGAAGTMMPVVLMDDGVAVVQVRGVLMKNRSSAMASTSTIELRRTLRALRQDTRVRSCLLVIDSPGGTVSGTEDAANEVRMFAKVKPIHAVVYDLCASGAVWLTAYCQRIVATSRTAMIGSIGVLWVVDDTSAAAKAEGRKVFAFATDGGFKATAVDGTELTAEQQEYLQGLVNETGSVFFAAVSQGRKLKGDRLKAVTNGKVFQADEAIRLGLIDGMASEDEALRVLKTAVVETTDEPGEVAQSQPGTAGATVVESEDDTVSEQNKANVAAPATLEQLQAEIKGADPAFLVKCLQEKMTVTQALKYRTECQQAALENRDKEIAALKAAKSAGSEGNPSGVTSTTPKPVKAGEGGAGDGTDPVAEFQARVKAKMAGGMDKDAAVAAVKKADPKLHGEFLYATNTDADARRIIADRYGLTG